MLNRFWVILFAVVTLVGGSVSAEAKPKTSSKRGANRTTAALKGCQISRKGTKIRCPQGLFIREDVVNRRIAGERSRSPSSTSKRVKKKRSSRR